MSETPSSSLQFIARVLDPPSYGFIRDGVFYKPTTRELFREFFGRLNIFRSRKNWLVFFGWMMSLSLVIPFFIFLVKYFSWPLAFTGFIYSMVYMGSFGTFWLHRYSTHQAFKFKNGFFRSIFRNICIPIIPEEIYVFSHHVHHSFSEKPGDPYNVNGGGIYCFLSDAIHQMINPNLSEADYERAKKLMAHTGIYMNSYAQYQKWGSVCHPVPTILHFFASWAGFYSLFYLVGGHALATALFGCSAVWAFGVRTINYDGHGRGKDRRRDGIDFNRDDWSVNQTWPGVVAGEWHNNHHLYPNGARSGFLKSQIDFPWYLIKGLHKVGIVSSYRDYQAQFMTNHLEPYRRKMALEKIEPSASNTPIKTPLNSL